MNCPNCNEELYDIGVIVQATCKFNTEIVRYTGINEIEETLGYYCPECGNELPFETTDNYINRLIDLKEGGETNE